MNEHPEFNFDGRKERDEGIETVKENTPEEWRANFDGAVAFLASRDEFFTAEDIRAICGDPPNHPNAFSAAMMAAIRAEVIFWTHGFTPCQRRTSHARGGGLKLYKGRDK